MNEIAKAGFYQIGDRSITRMGYGAMQLAGPHVFGPPRDHAEAIRVLREVLASGVTHLDTSHFYGPHVTNKLIREALHPYPDSLMIVTKVGAKRGSDGSWIPALSPGELESAIHDNLRNLGLDVLEVVNLRLMFDMAKPAEGDIEEPLAALAELQRQGLIRHIGLSNATATQVAQGQAITTIVCVQNLYNLAFRADDALIDSLAQARTAYVPFFPLGGFSPLQSSILDNVARQCEATPMQVALAWLLQRSPNIMLIPGTSAVAHLRQNLASAGLELPPGAIRELNLIGTPPARHR
jgi:aryl-alcohol dehydrogenase-like predicted oxidoreductase